MKAAGIASSDPISSDVVPAVEVSTTEVKSTSTFDRLVRSQPFKATFKSDSGASPVQTALALATNGEPSGTRSGLKVAHRPGASTASSATAATAAAASKADVAKVQPSIPAATLATTKPQAGLPRKSTPEAEAVDVTGHTVKDAEMDASDDGGGVEVAVQQRRTTRSRVEASQSQSATKSKAQTSMRAETLLNEQRGRSAKFAKSASGAAKSKNKRFTKAKEATEVCRAYFCASLSPLELWHTSRGVRVPVRRNFSCVPSSRPSRPSKSFVRALPRSLVLLALRSCTLRCHLAMFCFLCVPCYTDPVCMRCTQCQVDCGYGTRADFRWEVGDSVVALDKLSIWCIFAIRMRWLPCSRAVCLGDGPWRARSSCLSPPCSPTRPPTVFLPQVPWQDYQGRCSKANSICPLSRLESVNARFLDLCVAGCKPALALRVSILGMAWHGMAWQNRPAGCAEL